MSEGHFLLPLKLGRSKIQSFHLTFQTFWRYTNYLPALTEGEVAGVLHCAVAENCSKALS